MREIKFRAIGKYSKRVFNWEDENWGIKKHKIGLIAYEIPEEGKEADELILLQYTGLKDKNGVEIYGRGEKEGNFETMPEGEIDSQKFRDNLSKIIDGRYSAGAFSERDGIHVVWGRNTKYKDWGKIRIFNDKDSEHKVKVFESNSEGMKEALEYVKKLKSQEPSPVEALKEELEKELQLTKITYGSQR